MAGHCVFTFAEVCSGKLKNVLVSPLSVFCPCGSASPQGCGDDLTKAF